MGGRDHSEPCPVCGVECGGLNDAPCDCPTEALKNLFAGKPTGVEEPEGGVFAYQPDEIGSDDGSQKYVVINFDDIDDEVDFDEYNLALAHMLTEHILLVTSHWRRTDELKDEVSLHVMCSDTFAYAYADCEPLHYANIKSLYQLFRKDPVYGPTAWCVARRKQRPIPPVAGGLIDNGYDLEALLRGELPQI